MKINVSAVCAGILAALCLHAVYTDDLADFLVVIIVGVPIGLLFRFVLQKGGKS